MEVSNIDLAIGMIGILVPLVIQGCKKVYQSINAGQEMSGMAAMWLTFGWSFVAGVVMFYIRNNGFVLPSGDPSETVTAWLTIMAAVVGEATVFYRMFLSPETRVIARRRAA